MRSLRPSLFLGLCRLPGTPSPNTSPLQGMLTPNLSVCKGPNAQHLYSQQASVLLTIVPVLVVIAGQSDFTSFAQLKKRIMHSDHNTPIGIVVILYPIPFSSKICSFFASALKLLWLSFAKTRYTVYTHNGMTTC